MKGEIDIRAMINNLLNLGKNDSARFEEHIYYEINM